MTERVSDNVVYIHEYLERKTKPTRADIQKRLADIAIEQMLLAGEKLRLEDQLRGTPE